MSVKIFLDSTKAPGLRFEILKYDKATNRALLKGGTGVPFEQNISKGILDKLGYKMVKEDTDAPPVDTQ